MGTAGQVIQIGDDQVGNTATLQFGAANQMVNPALNSLLVLIDNPQDLARVDNVHQLLPRQRVRFAVGLRKDILMFLAAARGLLRTGARSN